MKRLSFNSQGKLTGIDGNLDIFEGRGAENDDDFDDSNGYSEKLKTSGDLQFLNVEKEGKIENIFDKSGWSLYENGIPLKPLKFSNGKTQEDVVNEIVELVKSGERIIFLHGACGTGKSAIALNIARKLGRASIVVPLKNLQRQYEEDYTNKKYLLKPNGRKMKIAVITGRDNHDSLIEPGKSCADPYLPDTIKITEKNFEKINDYYEENPYLSGRGFSSLKDVKRISIAPANPYWSPIVPANYELKQLSDARKIKYKGVGGKEYIFYHRKEGCSYYDQYLSYKDADVIIFNSMKYRIELAMGRKPETDIEIIDEGDEFLDKLAEQVELNLNRLGVSLKMISPDNPDAREKINEIIELINLEIKNKTILGIDESNVSHIDESKIGKILRLFNSSPELEAEIIVDELNYANKALEAAKNLKEMMDDIYLSYRKMEDSVLVKLVSTNLSEKVREIVGKNKALVFMSGTIHSEAVLRNVFGIKNYKIVEAEAVNKGGIEIHMTGKEFDCKYSNFKNGNASREKYLKAFSECVKKSASPSLIQVNAFEDLPSDGERAEFEVGNLTSKDSLRRMQSEDKTDRRIDMFKSGVSDKLFSTKCSRGVDFPGDVCRSIIFTKYPYPNVRDSFWKVLQKTHPNAFWDFYKDKAKREFLQRIYRAVRSKDDHVFILSPDKRVLDAVGEMQRKSF